MPEILELKQTSEWSVGVGATLERKTKRGVFRLRVIEYEPNRKVAYEFTSGFVKGTTDSYSLETVGGKISVRDSVDVKLSGFYRLLGLLFSSRVRKAVEDRVGNLKRVLESLS